MSARVLVFLWLLIAPQAVTAQGFAGLGSAAEGYALPQRGAVFDFPADHGPHDGFRVEWWYVTANLMGEDGRDYGLQWTLFRSALSHESGEGWQAPLIWMGHAAVTTPDRHFAAERFARGGIGQAGVTAQPFEAWIDHWQMTGPDLGNVSLRADGPDFAYDMQLRATGPFVPQGDGGYSVKSPAGQASHYYSQPFYRVTGTLSLPDGPLQVTGQAWLDREWSSQPLDDSQTGWDWLSLHLDGGAKLMVFQVRDDTRGPFTVANWIGAGGTPHPQPDGAATLTPLREAEVAGRRIPVAWRVTLPDRELDIQVEALNDAAWMDTTVSYWEGPVRISGSHGGIGYLEMTGYE